MFETEHEFTLPKGYADEEGNLHRKGVMRLATAADEILPLKDPRVERNRAYFVIILISRVITRLGDIPHINPKVVESFFTEDLRYLEELYNKINGYNGTEQVACPNCDHRFAVEQHSPGGSAATL